MTGPCPSRRFEQEVIRIQLGKLDATKLDGVAAADLDQGTAITLLVAADGEILHVARAVYIGVVEIFCARCRAPSLSRLNSGSGSSPVPTAAVKEMPAILKIFSSAISDAPASR